MVSINLNQNFSDKNTGIQNLNSEETSLLDNIFATIFLNLEDENNFSKNSISKSEDLLNINNNFSINNTTFPLEILNINFDKILDKSKINLVENLKKIDDINLIPKNQTLQNKFEISFEIDIDNFYLNLKEKLYIFKNSINNIYNGNNKENKSTVNKNLNINLDLKNHPLEKIINQNIIKNDLEEFNKTNPNNSKNFLLSENLNKEKTTKKTSKNEKISNKGLLQNEIIKSQKILNIRDMSNVNLEKGEISESKFEESKYKEKTESISNFSNNKSFSKNIKFVSSTNSSNASQLETHLQMLEKNWGNKLAKIIERAILTGKEKITISLEPKRLGKLNLSLSLNQNNANIVINTENAASALLLNGAEDKLSQIFESAGLKLTNFQTQNNNNNNNNKNNNKKKIDENNLKIIEEDNKKEKIDFSKKKSLNYNNSIVNVIA